MTMGTNYRMLGPDERVEKGDEYKYENTWRKSGNWAHGIQMFHTEYRRPIPCPLVFVPQWKHPDAPGCPVHVLWAESPSTVRTVAQVAAEAKPEALEPKIEPGTGYRLLGDDEIVEKGDSWNRGNSCWSLATGSIGKKAGSMALVFRRKNAVDPGVGYRLVEVGEDIEEGDEWYLGPNDWRRATVFPTRKNISDPLRRKLTAPLCPIDPPAGYYTLGPDEVWREGDRITNGVIWHPLHKANIGKTTHTFGSDRWCCRKLPVPEPQYRPYANAAEAAAGLQGKLITHERSTAYYPVTRVSSDGVEVAEDDVSFSGLNKYWKFTDGTPCGVLITNQGKQ